MVEYIFKQVILVRSDLRMSLGKIAVQVAHSAVSAAENARLEKYDSWKKWMLEGQRKITLKVTSEVELLKYEFLAKKEELPNALIQDQGLTELPSGTTTCLAIGPSTSEKIDKLTGGLPLL